MNRISLAIIACIVALTGLVGISHRNFSELFGLAQASADQAVDGLEQSLPDTVRDRQLTNEIAQAKNEIIDHRVTLQVTKSEIQQKQRLIGQLEQEIQHRERILAESAPALERAASSDRATPVSFAGLEMLPGELEQEVDDLLKEVDDKRRRLTALQASVEILQQRVEQGDVVVRNFDLTVSDFEDEMQDLQLRRETAHAESRILDLTGAAGGSSQSVASNLEKHVAALRHNVEQHEARNAAREVSSGDRLRRSQLIEAVERRSRVKELAEQAFRRTNVAMETSDDSGTHTEDRGSSQDKTDESAVE